MDTETGIVWRDDNILEAPKATREIRKLENTGVIAERHQTQLRESGERVEESCTSIKRRSDVERAPLECIDLKAQLAALLQGETPPPAESIRQFERKIQSKRNESMRSLPDDFAPAL